MDWANNRPKDWDKVVQENIDWTDRDSLEVGADLMLEVLKAEGVYTKDDAEIIFDSADIDDWLIREAGYLVLIPVEEDEIHRD